MTEKYFYLSTLKLIFFEPSVCTFKLYFISFVSPIYIFLKKGESQVSTTYVRECGCGFLLPIPCREPKRRRRRRRRRHCNSPLILGNARDSTTLVFPLLNYAKRGGKISCWFNYFSLMAQKLNLDMSRKNIWGKRGLILYQAKVIYIQRFLQKIKNSYFFMSNSWLSRPRRRPPLYIWEGGVGGRGRKCLPFSSSLLFFFFLSLFPLLLL